MYRKVLIVGFFLNFHLINFNLLELTHGKNCEYCVPGSYGSATTSLGCTRCECNGHGDEQRGICDNGTGHCFCMNNTMGAQCDQCLPGFFGHPQ